MVEYLFVNLSRHGTELGVFFFLSTLCIFLLLEQVRGKLIRLRQFLTNRHFSLIKSPGLISCVNGLLKFICWVFLLLPFITLGVWSAALMHSRIKNGESPIGGIAVLLVGLAFFFFFFGILKIRWNNYRMNKSNLIAFSLAFAFFTSY